MALAVGALIFLALGAKGDSSSPAVSASPVIPAHPVIPAKAGIHTDIPFSPGVGAGGNSAVSDGGLWIPAFAGMTGGTGGVIAESALRRGARGVLDSRFRGNDKLGEWKRAEIRGLLGTLEKRAGLAVGDAAVSRFHFVKKARVDFRTSLGGRKGQFAIDALGGLRERGDDVIGWHLRGYAGEENARGGNAGLFWRVVKGESLLGANAFLDYERDENAGGFWRWSFGAEWKNKYGELSANRYWRITEGKQLADGYYYTREGFDADLYLRAPGLEWAALRGGYYQWKGERGDKDDDGFRYGLRLSPGGGVYLEAEYDEESGDFGGSFSYSHTFGEASAGAEKADGFNPRLHFYDSARREYSQRISRAGVGVSQFAAVLVSSGLLANITVGTSATVFAGTTMQINYEFPLTSDVNIGTGAGGATEKTFIRQQAGGWNLTLNANSRVAISQTARVLNVIAGGGEFERFGNNRLATVIMPGVTLRLLGTRFSWDIGGGGTTMTLHEGTVSVIGASAPFTISTVDDARAILADLGIGFATPGSFVFLTTGNNATVGNIAASGGYGTRTTAILGSPSGGFNLNANGLLFFTDAGNAATFTVTVTANDSHDNTDGVSLTVFVTLVTGIALPPPSENVVTVTTLTDEGVLAQFAASGGTDIRYGLFNAPASPTFAINANNGELRFAVNPHLPIAALTVTATASAQNLAGESQTITASVILAIADPPELSLSVVGDANLTVLTLADANAAVNVITLSLEGGAGAKSVSIVSQAPASNPPFVLAESGIISRASGNDAPAEAVIVVSGNDAHDNTDAARATITFALVAGINLPAPDDVLTVTTRIAAAEIVTLAAQNGSGFSYALLDAPSDITVAIGASDGELEFSEIPHTTLAERNITLTAEVRGTDSGGQPSAATARIMLAIVDPPELAIGFASPGSFVFLTTGGNATVGNVAASGGYGTRTTAILGSPLGGFAIDTNGVLLFSDAGNAATFTVTVTANDSHNNTDAVSLSVTVSVVAGIMLPAPSPFAGDILTVTTHTAADAIATLTAAGVANLSYALINAPTNITVALNGTNGELSFSQTPAAALTVALTAAASGRNPAGQTQTATVFLTLAIVNPPELTIGFEGTPLLSLLMTTDAVTIGTVAISGGDNPGNPDFAGMENDFSFVNDTVLVIANAANAGRFTTTVRASDSHPGVADVFLTAAVTLFSLRIITVTNTVTTGFSGATVYEGNITATARRAPEANRNRLIWLSPVEQAVTAANGIAVFTGERNTHGWNFPRYVGGGSPPYDAPTGDLDLVPRTVTVGNLTVTEMTMTMTATVAPDSSAVAFAGFEKLIVIPAKAGIQSYLRRQPSPALAVGLGSFWIPAFAGMTRGEGMTRCCGRISLPSLSPPPRSLPSPSADGDGTLRPPPRKRRGV